ncbi:DUF6950 family protein [Maritimibacter alkaliphilus]|uniref:DUF6950 family protein n=1 Tax=Maritimibacter alkaliphilus TaxID=404236 RepID=UPI001C93A393|nr:hypothetical protein [Maritimibacter alkaliphilus]MBY6091082.1 hypothetical protein [Maritimibacter alkaliphilus]
MDRAVLLHRYITSLRETPRYRLGQFDGAIFAADWVLFLTGADPIAEFRSGYASRRVAAEQLAEAGFSAAGDLAAARLQELSGWCAARVGDVAQLHQGRAACFGIVGGAYIHVVHPRVGLDVIRLSAATRMFRP